MISFPKPLSTIAVLLLSLGLCWVISVQYAFSMSNLTTTLHLPQNDVIAASVLSSHLNKGELVEDPQIVWLASFPNSGRWCDVSCQCV